MRVVMMIQNCLTHISQPDKTEENKTRGEMMMMFFVFF